MENDQILAQTYRGGLLDCSHHGSVVVVNLKNEILFSKGDPEKLVVERSVTKPLKTVGLVECGAYSRYKLDQKDLAIISGSHSGSKAHVKQVNNILKKLGLDSEILKCGIELPLGRDGLMEFINGTQREISSLNCDCSGEHAGLLAICLQQGYSLEDYFLSEHPVQKYSRKIINEFIKIEPKRHCIDGCQLPTFHTPLRNLALGMANFCNSQSWQKSCYLVQGSIFKYPILFGGIKERYDTELIISSENTAISKAGAEGLYTMGFPEKGIGIAIKISDGNHRAAPPVLLSIFDKLELFKPQIIENIRLSTSIPIYTNNGTIAGKIISTI